MLLSLVLVGVGLQSVPSLPFLPELATEAKADPPTLSGAEPAYPLNHTIDGLAEGVGDSLPNADFEDPSAQVGSPPGDADLEDDPVTLATPDNNDFETGTFSDWTTTGSPTIQTTGGDHWAKLGASQTITSTAVTVPSGTQAVAYNVNYVTSSASGVRVYALSGAGFSTSTELLLDNCGGSCGYWDRSFANVSAFVGQEIKIRFVRFQNEVGIDDVSLEETFPSLAMIDACHDFFVHTQGDLEGSSAGDIQQPVEGDPSDAPTTHPGTPVPPVPPGGGSSTQHCDPPPEPSGIGREVYRYTTQSEADAARRLGFVPNVDAQGLPRTVFYATDFIASASAAEVTLQIGQFNPGGPTPSPTYRITVDPDGADWCYGGNVENGDGIELLTRSELKVLRIDRLDP